LSGSVGLFTNGPGELELAPGSEDEGKGYGD
jgi:hypothetical protein